MTYPTDVKALLLQTDEEWEALLASVWNAPVPRVVVRLGVRAPRKSGNPSGVKSAPPGRHAYAWARIHEGASRKDVAAELGVSASMLSRILTGARN